MKIDAIVESVEPGQGDHLVAQCSEDKLVVFPWEAVDALMADGNVLNVALRGGHEIVLMARQGDSEQEEYDLICEILDRWSHWRRLLVEGYA